LSHDENAFLERLIKEMHDLLVNYANVRLKDYSSACDVVQETYLAAQKNINKLMDSKNLQGWLIETLKFKILHEKRAKARFLLLTQKIAQDVSIDKSHVDMYEYDISETLMEDEYEILRILYIEGYSIKEAAAKFGITYEACKKRVQTAKRRLAQELQ